MWREIVHRYYNDIFIIIMYGKIKQQKRAMIMIQVGIRVKTAIVRGNGRIVIKCLYRTELYKMETKKIFNNSNFLCGKSYKSAASLMWVEKEKKRQKFYGHQITMDD